MQVYYQKGIVYFWLEMGAGVAGMSNYIIQQINKKANRLLLSLLKSSFPARSYRIFGDAVLLIILNTKPVIINTKLEELLAQVQYAFPQPQEQKHTTPYLSSHGGLIHSKKRKIAYRMITAIGTSIKIAKNSRK